MKTFMQRKEDIKRTWYVVDASGIALGRLATEVASVLRGKNKTTFTPHIDGGDFVIVINSDLVVLTGDKEKNKLYYRHSGFPGGLKATKAGDMLKNNSPRLIELAVKGMLPKNRLGRKMYKKLFVYKTANHKHAAQKPEVLSIGDK